MVLQNLKVPTAAEPAFLTFRTGDMVYMAVPESVGKPVLWWHLQRAFSVSGGLLEGMG